MKKSLSIVMILIGASADIAIGHALRWKLSIVRQSSAINRVSLPGSGMKEIPGPNRTVPATPQNDSPLARQLAHDLSISSPVTKWLFWLEAIEKAKPSDFLSLFQAAQGNPAAMRLVATRWAEIAPRHLFDTLISESKNGWSFWTEIWRPLYLFNGASGAEFVDVPDNFNNNS